jgi:TolB-like protein/tetratricopeptide (TPR) repeat protein
MPRAPKVAKVVAASLLTFRALAAQCPDGSPPPCGHAGPRAPAPNSVAVLYFDDLSRDTSDAYVADGMTEELITRLGQIDRLQVKSRTAVQRYRGRPIDDPAVVGRTLNVAHLVSGTVQQGGGRLRVTVELTRAASGMRIWGESYERPTDDLMAVEAEIAQAIAQGVGGRLAPGERRSLAVRATRNPGAYDHFLRGNSFLARRTPADVRLAIEQYEQAVHLDSTFTGALARIGYAYALFLDWGWPFPGLTWDSVLTRGFAVADRALALDSSAADAWMARGYLLSFRNPRTFEGVNAAFQRAIALDPRNAEAHHQYGYLLLYSGGSAGGRAEEERALALEPERPISLLTLASERRFAGRFDEARTLVDSALAVDPGAGYAYARRSLWRPVTDVTGARADAEAAVRLRSADYPIEAEAALAAAEFRGGDIAAARARLERLSRSLVVVGPQAGYCTAMAFAVTGDGEGALAVLERMVPRGAVLWSIMRDPWFDAIRTDPRFLRLFEESRPLER